MSIKVCFFLIILYSRQYIDKVSGGQINQRANPIKGQQIPRNTEWSSFTVFVDGHTGSHIKALVLCFHFNSSVSPWQ